MSQQPEKSVAQVLRDAAAIVERGWCQRRFGVGTDCACASEAIRRAAHGAEFSYVVHVMNIPAWKFFSSHIGEPFVSEWNDSPQRTQAEVVAKLLEAADLAEGDSNVTA